MPDNLGDRLFRALRAVDPTAPAGPHQMVVSGTVNIGGGAVGGAGGTSMVDNNTFTPGGTSITPAGGYVGGRQVASGNAGAFAMSASAILQVHVVAGGAGGGVANLTVQGTAGNDVNVGFASGAAGAAGNWALPVVYASGVYATVNVAGIATVNLGNIPTVNLGLGTINVGNVHGVVGSQFVIGRGGSMGVVNLGGSVGVMPIGDFTVWNANPGAGGGFASVAVYGSPGMPVYVIGTMNVTNLAAGNGFASVAVYGSPGMPVYNVGTVHISNAGDIGGGTGFASVAVYGSPAMPVYNIGTVHIVNAPNVGVIGIPGSVHILGSINPVGVFAPGGSVQVIGSVHVANSITASIPNVVVTDTRGSLTPTQWPFSFGGSGYFAIANAPGANNRIEIYAVHLSTAATVRTMVSFQSPSGTYLTGSLPIPPGGGFNVANPVNSPVWLGGTNGTIYISASGTENMAGWLSGYVRGV
jgi:hypothetical protein